MADPTTSAIGSAIDGEDQKEQSKVGKFFKDPKNLATMLVMGAALAQNRRGQSFGAHLGKAAVGGLGFRGGLETELDAQKARRAEASSVQEDRLADNAADTERNRVFAEQNDISRLSEAYDVQQGQLDRDNALAIARMQASAMTAGRKETLLNTLMKSASDAYMAALSDPLNQGKPVDPNQYFGMPFFVASLLDPESLPEGMLAGFEATLPPTDETTLSPDGTTESQVIPTPDVAVHGGLRIPARNARSLRKDLPADRITTVVAGTARQKHPEMTKDMTDSNIMSMIDQIQQIVEQDLASGMTEEQAKALKNDKFKFDLLNREQQKEVARIARGPVKPMRTPSTL